MRGMSSGHIWQDRLQRKVSSNVTDCGVHALPPPTVYGIQYLYDFRLLLVRPRSRSQPFMSSRTVFSSLFIAELQVRWVSVRAAAYVAGHALYKNRRPCWRRRSPSSRVGNEK